MDLHHIWFTHIPLPSNGYGYEHESTDLQQFIDLVFQDDLIKRKQNFDVIMDDTFIHLTADNHMDNLLDLFKVLQKYGLKISPHKCKFFKKKIVYMGLEFQVEDDKVCYTPLKDKCKAIQNLDTPKILKQTKSILWHGQFSLFVFTKFENDLFHLENDTSQKGVGGTLIQKQGMCIHWLSFQKITPIG